MKHKFRKLIFFLLVTVIFNMSVCPVQASERYSFYFGFDFSSVATGSKPSGMSVTTKADCNTVGVVSEAGLDGNCMQILKSGTDGDPYFDISISNYYNEAPSVLKFSVISPETTSTKHITVRTTKDSTAYFHELMRFTNEGKLKVGGNDVGTYEANVRYDCAIVLGSSDKSTLSCYVTANGKTTAYENISFNNWGDEKFGLVRFQMPKNQVGSVCYDNIYMYIGSEVISSDEHNSKTIPGFIPDDVAKAWLDGAVVMFDDRTDAYCGGITKAGCSSVVKDGTVYVPAEFAVNAFGGTVSENSDGKSVSVNSDSESLNFNLNEDYIISDGNILLEADKLCALFGKAAVYDEKYGIIIIADSSKTWTDAQIKTAYNFITYSRPTAEKILTDFEPMKNVHPRIYATAETFEAVKEKVKTDSRYKKWYSSAIQTADGVFAKSVTEYVKDNRSTILDKARQVLSRSQSLAFAYRMTGDARYAERLWLELEAAGNFPDWNHQNHFLDTAEMTNAFAVGYDWCYDYWSDERKEFLENAIITHGLNAGVKAYAGESGMSSSWVKATHNWNEVCNSGMSVGALALLDVEPELCSGVLELAFLSCESMLSGFGPDGAWDEGVGYWAYTANYLAYHMSSLNAALGTDYGYANLRGIDKTGYYPTIAQSAQGNFNFHDAGSGYQNSASVFYLANRLNDENLTKVRLNEMESYNMNGGLLDILWFKEPSDTSPMQLDKDVYVRETELTSFRSSYFNNEALFAGLHGGYNKVNHGNLDAGTFVLDALGERWASDLGSDNYALSGYFGTSRWKYYRLGAQGQNVIALDPLTTYGQETEAFARFEKFETSDRGGFAVLDTSSAYGSKVTYSKRGIKTDFNRTQVLLQDEMNLAVSSDLWWFMHTKASIDIASDGKSAVLTIGDKQMKAFLHSNVDSAVFEDIAAEPLEGSENPDGQGSNEGYRRLAVHIDEALGEVIISVRFVPIANDITVDNAAYGKYLPMDEWTNDTGFAASALSVEADGIALEDFQPDKKNYTLYLPYGTKTPPTVTATVPEGYEAEITQAAAVKASAVIRVYETGNRSNYATYTVNFPVRSTVIRSMSDDFEAYTEAGNLSASLWSTSQVLPKAGPHVILSSPGYDGKTTKSFGIAIPAGTTTGNDPALVTKALDFTHPMKLKFDVMADSMDSKITVVLREGYTPNWIYPLSKSAGKTNATAFGIPVDGFEMEAGKWYRFEYEIYAEPLNDLVHFNLWINGEKALMHECIPCVTDADFQSVIIKFASTASTLAEDTVTVYWDNVAIHGCEFMATDVSITYSGADFESASQIKKGDVIKADIASVYEGNENLIVAFALYEKEGVLKQVSYKTFDASEELCVSLTAESDGADGEFYKVFVWKSDSMKPMGKF